MKLMFYFQNKEVDINKTISVYFVWLVILSFTARVIYLNNNTKNYPVVDENSSYASSEENGYVQEEAPAVEEAPASEAEAADTAPSESQKIGVHVYSNKRYKIINPNTITYNDIYLNSPSDYSVTTSIYYSTEQTAISVKIDVGNGIGVWVDRNNVSENIESDVANTDESLSETNSNSQSSNYSDILYQLESNYGKSVDYSNLFADNVLAFIMLKNVTPQKIKYIFETEKEYLNQSIYDFGTLTYKSDKDGYKHYILPAKLKCYRQSLKQTETSDVDILLAFDENNKIVKFVFMNKSNTVRE